MLKELKKRKKVLKNIWNILDVHGVTGSSPVLSTIKSLETTEFQGFLFSTVF